ncbi:hypothetical protein GIB67_016722 [Kingdonia uniflora]|uniref:Aminotransferase-like plant mobile domain-containing protein n=1 Tax=Kingdonia uniflora TaxID=39325 RepID=A0A7J7LMA3_9MAGN|nr:hypothetical protein GIB67_016722 [Kingdonia uniflora]
MTPTLDNVEQLIGFIGEGDVTVIGGTWGFLALLEVFEMNLLLDLKGFKALKVGGAGNSLSLKKLREHYAYKLGKVLSDGTTARAKKKGLTARKKGTDVSARYLDLFAKDKVAKKWSWGSNVLAHMYHNLGAASRDDGRKFACCTTILEIFVHFPKLIGIPAEMDSDQYEDCTCWKWGGSVTDRYGGPALLKFKEVLDKYKGDDVVWDPYRDKRDFAHGFKKITYFYDDDVGMFEIHQKNQACVNGDGDTLVDHYEDSGEQYHASQIKALNDELQKLKDDKDQESEAIIKLAEALKEKSKENESLKAVNAFLMEHIDLQLLAATPRKKLVNAEEMKKSLEVNNNEWEVWCESLKKALASEGMGNMGDPTFEELFDQNERFFTITQQGPKGDYQEDLVSMGATLENVVIARGRIWLRRRSYKKFYSNRGRSIF